MSPKALKGPERTLSGELRTGLLAGSLGFSSQGVCPQGSHQSVLKTRRTASPEQEELRGRLPERRSALDGSWGFSGPISHTTPALLPQPIWSQRPAPAQCGKALRRSASSARRGPSGTTFAAGHHVCRFKPKISGKRNKSSTFNLTASVNLLWRQQFLDWLFEPRVDKVTIYLDGVIEWKRI